MKWELEGKLREVQAEREQMQLYRIGWEEEKNAVIKQVKDLETRLEAKRLKVKKWKAEAQSNLSRVPIEPPSFEVTSPTHSQLSTSATQVLETSTVSTPRYPQALELTPRENFDFSSFRSPGLGRKAEFGEGRSGSDRESRLKREINGLLQEILGEPRLEQFRPRSFQHISAFRSDFPS